MQKSNLHLNIEITSRIPTSSIKEIFRVSSVSIEQNVLPLQLLNYIIDT